MGRTSLPREFSFLVKDVARLLRTCADARVRPCGMTWAQWAVLARLERQEGLIQSELAENLDLQPITLTRLIDRLCDNGLIERRADPHDRRAKRLFLTPAARPLLERLWTLGQGLMGEVLAGIDDKELKQMVDHLATVRTNLRAIIDNRTSGEAERDVRHV
jgi:MarR family transcriptional regulator, transcriptional regulator for hemolysin